MVVVDTIDDGGGGPIECSNVFAVPQTRKMLFGSGGNPILCSRLLSRSVKIIVTFVTG